MPVRKSKPTLASRRKEITAYTDQFCGDLLNDEYRDVCRVMVKNLCVAGSPALKGDARLWAAAVVAAVGYVNGLDDMSFEPHYTRKDLAKRLGYTYSGLKKYVDALIEGFDLTPYDLDFTIPSLLNMNPLLAMISSPSVLLRQCCGGSCDSGKGSEQQDCCQLRETSSKRKSKSR